MTGAAPASAAREELVRVCDETLAPLVEADGGEVWLVAVDAERIALHLAGKYAGCPGATLASKHVIEPALRAVSPGVHVVVTSGIRIPGGAERLPRKSVRPERLTGGGG